MAPSATSVSTPAMATFTRRATQIQSQHASLLVDPNPIILGLLIFTSSILIIAALVGIAIFIHNRRPGFGRKKSQLPKRLYLCDVDRDLETTDEYSVLPKARLASPRVMQERSYRPLSLPSGTSTARGQVEQTVGSVSVATDSNREPTPPTETLPARYTLTLNCDIPSILAVFQPSTPDPSSDPSSDNPSIASPEQPSLALTSPVSSNASVLSFGDGTLLRYASELFVKPDTQTKQNEPEDVCQPSASSSTARPDPHQEKEVSTPSPSIQIEENPELYGPIRMVNPSKDKDTLLFTSVKSSVSKRVTSRKKLGPGLVILAIRIASVAKEKDKRRHRPLTKRSDAENTASARFCPASRKERSSWAPSKSRSPASLPQTVAVYRMHANDRCFISIRRFLQTYQRNKLPLASLCTRHSFLEISGPELEQDIADLEIASDYVASTKTSRADGDISETQDIADLTATSYCSAGNDTSCGGENVAIAQEPGSFFAWNDDTTTVDSQTHIASVTGDDSPMSSLVNSSAGNILQISAAGGNVVGSESSTSSFLEKTVKRASDVLIKTHKENSPKVSSPKEKLKRGRSQKKPRKRTPSTSPQLRSSPSGFDRLQSTTPPASPHFPTISIAINGIPASDSHYSSSFYVQLTSPRAESTTPLSPDLLNTDWAPRPPLRERPILLSLRLTSRGFGALRGRSLGCYATMDSTLESVKCSVEDQLGYEVVLRGMVRVSTLPTWDVRRQMKGAGQGECCGEDEWVYATIADDGMFSNWVEERVLADGEGAALDVCIAEKRWF